MTVLHVQIIRDDSWLVAEALEEPGVMTQGRTLDEVVSNLREVIQLMFDSNDAQLELILL